MAEIIDEGTIFGVPALRLSGKIVESTSRKASQKLDVLTKKNQMVVVDVSGVEFMDSQGLGALMYHYTLMQRSGRKLVLLNTNTAPAAYMRILFSQTHLDNVLTILSSPAEVEKLAAQS